MHGYHSKGNRLSSRCKTCVNEEKQKYRKRKIAENVIQMKQEKKKQARQNKFQFRVQGELCEISRNDFIETLSDYLEDMAA